MPEVSDDTSETAREQEKSACYRTMGVNSDGMRFNVRKGHLDGHLDR
jgi:hypothetical protein